MVIYLRRRKWEKQRKEVYEDYWKFTAALTDICGNKFKNALSVIVNYIDQNKTTLEENAKEENNFNASPLYKELLFIVKMNK